MILQIESAYGGGIDVEFAEPSTVEQQGHNNLS